MLVTAQVRPMGYGPEDAARNSRVYHLYYGPHAETECRPHVDRADALDERTGDNHDTQPSFAPNVSPVPAGILAKEPSVAVNCCLTWLDLVTCD
jgi:hypothetical protein